MALDHVRDYFHADAFLYDPLDLSQTNVPLFFTRWITHFCAPVFVFLAGTSAYLVGQRKGKKALSFFLLSRGLWLVFLELTVVNFGWLADVHFSTTLLLVIWALGISMIALSAFIHLPKNIILVLGLIIVAGHNLLDVVRAEGNDWKAVGWAIFHETKFFQFGDHNLLVAYPVLAWIGVMTLGYCFGSIYTLDSLRRKKILVRLGMSAIALFIIIRMINVYGDPIPWSVQSSPIFTLLSFLNTFKYPPSLLYLLMTLGPSILFLAYTERPLGKTPQPLVAVGRVPMFYYILHIYLIHSLAILAAMITGFDVSALVNIKIWVTDNSALQGYGFGLWAVYGVWIFVVLLLLPLCQWYDRYKRNNRDKWWLSYL
jgi:uncharacterized membrane protein